jgi:hypothetical protein
VLRRIKALWKPLGIILIAGLASALCGLGIWHLRNAAALRELDEARSRLRDQGVAVTFDDLPGAPPPEDENAAPLYEAAFKRLEEEDERILEDEESEGDLPLALEDPWHLEEAAVKDLYRYEPFVELLGRATTRPRCAFRIEYKGLGTPHPYIPRLRDAMNLMIARTAECARDGDVEAAFESLHIAGRMAPALKEEAFLVGQLARIGLNAQVLEALEVLLPLADDPARVFQRVAPDTCRGAVWKGLRGEVVIHLDIADENAADLAGMITPDPSLFLRLKVPAFRADLAFAAELIARALDAEDLPYPEQLLVREEILSEVNANPQLIVTRMMVPVQLAAILEEGRNASRVAMARLAAELLAFRRRTGAFPEALEALGLGRPARIDPYTERPFRLLRRDEGTWIASEAAPLDDEDDVRWVLEDEEGEFAWARWRVDAPLPPRSRPEEKSEVEMLKAIARSLGIRVSRRGLTEEEWFEKVKARVEAAGVGIQFGPDDGKAK